MAIQTWSATFSSGSFLGTTWQAYNITSSDVLPSNAVITKIEYSINSYVGKVSKSSSYNFQLYGIAVQNGPYTSTSYNSSSATNLVDTMNCSSNTDGSSTTSSFENGTASVYRSGTSRTYFNLVDCDFKSNLSSTTPFYNYTTLSVKVRVNNSGPSDWTQYISGISVKVTYSTPSVSRPTNLKISQNNDATFTLDWDDCQGTGGSGSIVYGIYDDTDYGYIRDIDTNPVTESKYIGSIPEYNTTRQYSIIAKYSGIYSGWSDIVSIIFYKPSINDPYSLTINQTSGTSCTLSWQAASLNYTTGNITYSILKNNTVIKTTASTSYTFNENEISQWGTQQVELTVKASASITGNTASGSILNSNITNIVVFTYIPPYKTILRYSGSGSINGYEECIVYYYTGDPNKGINGWEECEVYRYTGESNATINGWQLCSYT